MIYVINMGTVGVVPPPCKSRLSYGGPRSAALSAAATGGHQVTLEKKGLGGGAWSAAAHDLGWGAGVT